MIPIPLKDLTTSTCTNLRLLGPSMYCTSFGSKGQLINRATHNFCILSASSSIRYLAQASEVEWNFARAVLKGEASRRRPYVNLVKVIWWLVVPPWNICKTKDAWGAHRLVHWTHHLDPTWTTDSSGTSWPPRAMSMTCFWQHTRSTLEVSDERVQRQFASQNYECKIINLNINLVQNRITQSFIKCKVRSPGLWIHTSWVIAAHQATHTRALDPIYIYNIFQ